MTHTSYLFGIAAAIIAFIILVEMLRRRRLRERHALWWFIAAVLALFFGIFPQALQWVSDLVGITVPTNLVFFVGIFLLFFVSIQQSAELTSAESRVRMLAEQSALQDKRIRDLERAIESQQTSRDDSA